jgi:hypothetical protein
MTMAFQKEMSLNDARWRPMLELGAVKGILDLGEAEVRSLLDEGKLTGWDIGLGDTRRELRLWTPSVRATLATRCLGIGTTPQPGLPEDPQVVKARTLQPTKEELWKSLLPPGHTRAFLTNPELQRMMNCTSSHVIALVQAGEVMLQPDTDYGRGVYGAALVTVASVRAFLERRRA